MRWSDIEFAKWFAHDKWSEAPDGYRARIESGAVIGSGAWIESGARIESGAVIESGARIGSRARIGSGAWIGSGARIGSRARIGSGAWIGVFVHQYAINIAGHGLLRIGCEIRSFDEWRERGDEIARSHNELEWYRAIAVPLIPLFQAQHDAMEWAMEKVEEESK